MKVYYTGTLINGTVFDGTSPGLPASFKVNSVIPGWIEALQLMREGDHWQLVIPPNLGYGARGAGNGRSRPTRPGVRYEADRPPRPRPGGARRAISPIPTTRGQRAVGQGFDAARGSFCAVQARHWRARCASPSRWSWWWAPARCSGPAATTPWWRRTGTGRCAASPTIPAICSAPAIRHACHAGADRPRSGAAFPCHRPYPHLYGGWRHGQGAGDRPPLWHDGLAGHLDQPRPGQERRADRRWASRRRWPTAAPSTG